MVNSNGDDFFARATASFNNQMSLVNANDGSGTAATTTTAAAATTMMDIESYAKSLVEDDLPKIDAAVKSYLSLVAARSAVASDIDVVSDAQAMTSDVQCTFASFAKNPMDANRCALVCARILLSTINSTTIPPGGFAGGQSAITTATDTATESSIDNEAKNDEEMKIQLQNNATRVLWNNLVQSSKQAGGDKAKQTKPSKVLGRDSLIISYSYIQERFRRGVVLLNNSNGDDAAINKDTPPKNNNPLHSLSNELLPPVSPPKEIDIDQWQAFYTEFGNLLSRAAACKKNNNDTNVVHDDSALLWSCDKGSAELQQRREMRAQRATEALASVDGAKAAVADALGGGSCPISSVAEESSHLAKSSGVSERLLHHTDHSGAEPAIVFIHGLACDGSDWIHQVQWCQNNGRRAITLDLRGHGQSTHFTSDFTMETMGGDVVSLLRHLGVNSAVVAGHSMGMRVAVEVALQAPGTVIGVALVDGNRRKAPGNDPDDVVAKCQTTMEQIGYAKLVEFIFGPMFQPGAPADEKQKKEYIMNRARALPSGVGTDAILSCLRWDVADFDRCYGQLAVPLLVIQSTHEHNAGGRVPVTADMDIEWHRDVKACCGDNAEFELVTECCGHFTMLDAPDVVNASLGRLFTRCL